MQAGIDVLTIGNAIVDVIAKVDDAFVQKNGLVKGSMNLIDEAMAEALYASTVSYTHLTLPTILLV